jgi:hypothetical protein
MSNVCCRMSLRIELASFGKLLSYSSLRIESLEILLALEADSTDTAPFPPRI